MAYNLSCGIESEALNKVTGSQETVGNCVGNVAM